MSSIGKFVFGALLGAVVCADAQAITKQEKPVYRSFSGGSASTAAPTRSTDEEKQDVEGRAMLSSTSGEAHADSEHTESKTIYRSFSGGSHSAAVAHRTHTTE